MSLQDKELIQAFYKAIELNSTWTQESLGALEEMYGYLGPSPLQMDGSLWGVWLIVGGKYQDISDSWDSRYCETDVES